MGLLDDMGPLLKGKPKVMPGMDFGLPDIAPGVGKPPMDFGIADLAKPPGADQQRSMDFALNDIAPGAQAPGPAMGPTGKIASQLGEGSKALPQIASAPTPSPTEGLLAANTPMPPSRPPGLGGMPPTRSAAAVPLPPPRPPGLGGTDVASVPPMPPIRPPDLGGAPGPIASAAPIAPVAPPIAPPPLAPQAPAAAAGGAMGGAGGLAGLAGPLSKIAGAMQGKPGPPPPQAKAPQIAPSNIGAEVGQQQAAAKAQAPQVMQGLLAPMQQDTLDPRKRRPV